MAGARNRAHGEYEDQKPHNLCRPRLELPGDGEYPIGEPSASLRLTLSRVLAILAVTPAGVRADPAPDTPTASSSACGTIRFGARTFVVFRQPMRCPKAKHLARKVRREKQL